MQCREVRVLPEVAIGSLGGTITMTSAGPGGVAPTLSARDLIASVPDLEDTASISAATLATLPGASLTLEDVLAALRWAADAVGSGAAGVVLVQGTDTIEETAYLLDLHWDHDEPLVITGAMRSPSTPGADGAANLLAAVTVAADAACRGLGALVVLNDEVHAAGRVRKGHATDPGAFVSPVFGPLAVVSERRVIVGNRVPRLPALPLARAGVDVRIALVEACLGDDGTMLRLVHDAGYDGAVVAGFGVGHVPFALADAVADCVGPAGRSIPVVLASTTGAGTTLRQTYGFTGSETDLLARGAIPAGWLGPRKARMLLWSLLAADASREVVHQEFDRRGGTPSGTALTAKFTPRPSTR